MRTDSNGITWYKADFGWTSQEKYSIEPKVVRRQRVSAKTAARRRAALAKRKPVQPTPELIIPEEPDGTPERKTKGGIIIHDPSNPYPIFDGNVPVYSTCRDCGKTMIVVNADETVHPTCTPRPTKLESLATGWLSCVEAGDEESAKLTELELQKYEAKPPNLKAAALKYVSWGWPVFPLRANTKEPATKHGFLDATADPKRVKAWWTRHPDHNIGLPTGRHFDVFDVDPANGGVPSFLELLAAKRIPQTHGIVVTASGGIHMYLKPTGRGNRANFMPGLDYRGKGGYVVAPPSTLGERGRAWSWLTAPSPKIKGE
jgi:Bifunctional DNA primase/polymerase, N-terminal